MNKDREGAATRAQPCGEGLRTRLLPWARRWAAFLGLLVLFCLPCAAAGQAFATANPNEVEAAFIRNFARYVTWPGHAFADDRSPWQICILGSDLFDDVLEKTFKGRTEQGRSFEVFRAETLDHLPPCQIIFIGFKDPAKRRSALGKLRTQPVLTVGDAPNFLQEGGIVRFQVGDHVEMSINLDQARSVSLQIQTRLLEVTREVVENGTTRRRK